MEFGSCGYMVEWHRILLQFFYPVLGWVAGCEGHYYFDVQLVICYVCGCVPVCSCLLCGVWEEILPGPSCVGEAGRRRLRSVLHDCFCRGLMKLKHEIMSFVFSI
jgi:hypothetical protein